jgi:hypothetical protein
MEGNIFESKKERELQILRQQLASNVVKVDPSLKGYLDRYDPDVSRATLLRLQRQKIPTKEELEKLEGVKTAKKLKGRRGKNLRGEVARAIREQKRFEKGERRYKPEEEPRIVGEPAPQGATAGGFSYDPEVEKERIRVQALGQLQTARIANRRIDIEARQLEINKLLADRERGERQRQFNIEDIRSRERLDIEGRQLQSLLDRQADDRDRFEEDIIQRKKERRLQRDLQARALETEEFRTEQEKRLRELEIGKRDVIEAEKLRVHDELKSRELDLLERRLDLDTQRALRSDADPIPEGLSHADREFLQRGFERGLETLERRFGENEARIQEQIRTHADRVARQQPVEIKLVQPQAQQQGELRGATAEQIASSVREALKEFRSSPRRRLSIESASTDTSEEDFSPRGARAGRVSPPPEELVFEGAGETEAEQQGQEEAVGFSPVQTPRPTLKKAEPTPLTAEEIAQPIEDLPERREPEPEEPEESGVFAGGIEAAAQNAIGFVGDVAGRAARGIAGLFEPAIGEQTGGRLDPEGQVFGLGQEIEFPIPTIQPVPSAEPERRPAVVETSSSSANLTPERIRINRDILESNIQANSERYQTEFADKFKEEEERLRQGWLQEHYSKKPSLSSDDKERIRRAVFNDPLGDLYKPEFKPEKYQSRSEKYITKNKDKQLYAKSDLYKQQLDKQKNLLKDVDQRLQSNKLDFSSQEAGLSYVKSLTENEPQKILSGPPVIPPRAPIGPPPKASGKVEDVEEEQPKIEALGEDEGLLEEEVQAVIQPSEMNTNLRLFESMEGEIDASYTRGRAQGGARGDLPFMITNLTDKTFKGLAPGQSVVLSQIEKDGRLGYFPGSRIRGEKVGITRINRDVLIKQIKSGKLKVDRVR